MIANIKQYRIKALKAILGKINVLLLDTSVKLWDYKLDDVSREILSLPPRPKDALPYIGWLGEMSKIKNESTVANISNKGVANISNKGLSLIKRWEGFSDKAYLCPGNVWTIGYGHTKNVKAGMCISRHQAEQLLKSDLSYFESQVKELVKVEVTQGQFDALVSFTFNVGVNAFRKSTLLKLLNQKDFAGTANQFQRWVHANGKKLPGLVSRRQEERNLFLT